MKPSTSRPVTWGANKRTATSAAAMTTGMATSTLREVLTAMFKFFQIKATAPRPKGLMPAWTLASLCLCFHSTCWTLPQPPERNASLTAALLALTARDGSYRFSFLCRTRANDPAASTPNAASSLLKPTCHPASAPSARSAVHFAGSISTRSTGCLNARITLCAASPVSEYPESILHAAKAIRKYVAPRTNHASHHFPPGLKVATRLITVQMFIRKIAYNMTARADAKTSLVCRRAIIQNCAVKRRTMNRT